MWLHEREVPQGRHAHVLAGGGGCTSRDAVLRCCGHRQHLPQVEDRAGDRGPALEDRVSRYTRLHRQRSSLLSK